MSASNILISVKNLTKSYALYRSPQHRFVETCFPFLGRRHTLFYALQDVSFEIGRGDIIGIIGRNGSGKSTLLKLITGVLTPTSGTVEVHGQVSALLELGVGFNPEYTGIENIRLALSLQGVSKPSIEEMIPNIASFADIGEHLYQPTKTYSSGMAVRLAFAVAISNKAEILIVDEALAVGDAPFQVKSMSYMQRIMASGTTILFVSHDTATVKRFCSRCIYLESGRIKAEGPSRFVTDMYARDLREEISAINRTTMHIGRLNAAGKIEREDIPAPEPCGDSANLTLSSETADFPPKRVERVHFKDDPGFHAAVELLREGSGEARFTCIEVLDEFGNPQDDFEFDQRICIRLHLRVHSDIALCAGYHIRNAQNLELLSSDMHLEGHSLIQGLSGDYYVVDFYTRLPLTAGRYNIQGVLSHLSGDQFFFLDVVEPCAIFSVNPREPQRIWAAMYIPNNVAVHTNPITD